MRRLLILSISLNVGLGAAILLASFRGVVRADAQVDEAPQLTSTGDTNGDSRVDVSDAVYLLEFLFLGGSDPSFCPPAAAFTGLAETGQTVCYGIDGEVIDCGGESLPGQDPDYLGCSNEGRFLDNQDGTVTDQCTGLMWEQTLGTRNVDWRTALTYCEDLELAGHDDWRLPNIREMHSIVDYGRVEPCFDPIFNALSTRYWSSTTDLTNKAQAWVVNGIFGQVANIVPKGLEMGAPRAVRNAR